MQLWHIYPSVVRCQNRARPPYSRAQAYRGIVSYSHSLAHHYRSPTRHIATLSPPSIILPRFSERLPPLFNSSCNPPEPDAETAADIYTYIYISGGQVHRTADKSVGPSDGRITRSPPELVGMWLHMRRAKPTSSIPTVTPCLVYRLVITCNRLIVIHPATSRYPRMIPERSEWERRSLTLVRGCAIPVLQ